MSQVQGRLDFGESQSEPVPLSARSARSEPDEQSPQADTEDAAGSDAEGVVGSDAECVVGSDAEGVVGSDAECVVGSDAECVVGSGAECVVGSTAECAADSDGGDVEPDIAGTGVSSPGPHVAPVLGERSGDVRSGGSGTGAPSSGLRQPLLLSERSGDAGSGGSGKGVPAVLVVRVQPDVVRLERTFDYVVPDSWHADGRASRLTVGTIVRVKLGGRRLRGWITEVGVDPPAGVTLQPLALLTGMGPPAELLDLARWAAWRWAGSWVSLLRAGSPDRVVTRPTPVRPPVEAAPSASRVAGAVTASGPRESTGTAGSTGPRKHVDQIAGTSDVAGAPTSAGLSGSAGVAGSTGPRKHVDQIAGTSDVGEVQVAGSGESAGAAGSTGPRKHVDQIAGTSDVGEVQVAGSGESAGSSRVAKSSGGAAIGGPSGRHDHLDRLFECPAEVTVLRCPPADDGLAVAQAAARRGDALIVVPGLADAQRIAAGLRHQGLRAAAGPGPGQWGRAAAGATVVGTRNAVWLPMPNLAAVVVIDEHVESLQSEQAPTWHAREVALERARRAGVPTVLTSPVPSLEALAAGTLKTFDRAVERAGWPVVEVLDRRDEDPVRGGMFAERLRDRLLDVDGRVAVVLNRKGRSKLLACAACGELARTSDNRASMELQGDELVAPDGSERRPVVCAGCGSTVLRNLRMGVTRVREDLAVLVGEPVTEVTADAGVPGNARLLIGTEAVLWRVDAVAMAVFLDFDQELLAPRQRAREQALALLARAARLTGGRRGGGRLIVQTRQPDHPVVQAAVRADPSGVVAVEREIRHSLGLSPFGAQAQISGAGAASFVEALRLSVGGAQHGVAEVSVRGPNKGKYLLRASSHSPLLELLARTPRPTERLRTEVDPLRV